MFTLWYLVLGYKEYKYARNGKRPDKNLDTVSKSPRTDSLKDESFGAKKQEEIQPTAPDPDPKSAPVEPPGGSASQTPSVRVKPKAPEPPKFTPQTPPAEPKPKPPEPTRFAPPTPPIEPQGKPPEPPRFAPKPEAPEPLKLVIPDLPPAQGKPPQAGVLSIQKNSGTPKTPESPSSKFPTGKAAIPEPWKMPERKGPIPREDEMLGRQGNRGPGSTGGGPKPGAQPNPRDLSYNLNEASGPVARGSSEEKTNISNPDSLDTSEDELEE